MPEETRRGHAAVLLGSAGATDPAIAGRKAATLASLAAAGFDVPPGVVVTAGACAAWTAGGAPPAGTLEELAAAVRELGGGPLAVRSSACAEDLPGRSYAGQYETVLDVSGDRLDDLCAAIGTVVVSARGERVRAYAGPATPGFAVLVQRQVRADAAGVAFTADPVTGDRDRTVVSAVRGLGTRLVDGTATPQEWVVRSGTVTCTSAGQDEDSDALTTEQAARVAALAERIAERADGPQDVEWAIEGDRVWLLQARPITALPVPPAVDLPPGTWVKETGRRAQQVTPLGASVVLPLVTETMATAFAELGALLERLEMRSVGGEVYLRVVPLGGHTGPPPPWWVLGAIARVVPAARRRLRAARRALRPGGLEAAVERWEREWRPELVAGTERLRRVEPALLSDADLDRHLTETIALLRRGLAMHFRLVPPYAVAVHRLVRCCHELFGWQTAQALELLTGVSEATVEPLRDLAVVAARVAASPAAVGALQRADTDVHAALRAADPEVGAAFDSWRERYGFRAVGDDVGASLGEQPHLLSALLREALERRPAAGAAAPQEDALARTRARLAGGSASDRQRFEDALALARRVYPTREDSTIAGGSDPAGLVRRTALEAGRRLTERGLLDRPQDAVGLDVDTLRAGLAGTLAGLRELVARSRAEQAWTAAHPGPPFHGPPPAGPPDFRGLPAAARELNTALTWVQAQQRTPLPPDGGDQLVVGAPAAPGTYTGPARVVRRFEDAGRVRPGDVLVCPALDPSWSVLFGLVGAVVTDAGGALSHAAIVAREHHIPAVLGTGTATTTLRDGRLVTVDGSAGRVTVRDNPCPTSEGER